MAALPEVRPGPQRIEGIDVARGLASILMIQGHAFDAWASEEAKRQPIYWIESALLQTLALPAFLVLAGASVALRIDAAMRRGQSAAGVRAGIARRGVQIVAVGYGLNAFSALLDGWQGPETWLRADVLHVIGLSLIVIAVLGVRGERAIDLVRLERVALALAIAPMLLCPLLTPISRELGGPLGWVIGLFSEVRGVTRMPLVPLIAWCAIGVVVGRAMLAWNADRSSIAGAPPRSLVLLLAWSLSLAFAASWAEQALLAAIGGPLDRAHPAVIPNAIQLAGRGVAVLAFGAWITPALAPWLRSALARLGRGSLWAYAFHIPFAYGAPGAWLRGLDLAQCALAALGLVLASFAVAAIRTSRRSY